MNFPRRSSLRRWLGFAFSATLLHPFLLPLAEAQHGPNYRPCLDTLAINSSSVVVGKIVEIHGAVSNVPYHIVSVRVEQWLKGGAESGTIETRFDTPARLLMDWKDRESRLLIFTDLKTDKFSGIEGNAIDLSDPNKVFTADMKVLTDLEQILQATQKAIERYRGVSQVSTFQRSLPAGVINDLSLVTAVPIDEGLEHWAQSVLDADVNGISAGPTVINRDAERKEAVQALGYFPSEANATRLKLLLNDPAVTIDRRNGVEIYFLRQYSYEALLRMGVKVSEPLLRKDIVRP